jgi:hydrogenase small subunit
MSVSRRQFLKYCTASAAALGLASTDLRKLEAALGDGAPTVVWLHGSGCQGDSISFLNLTANMAPVGDVTADSVLIDTVNLAYHSVLMSSAGETAVTMANQAKRKGGYVLVIEGAIPTAFGGNACRVWSENGQTVTVKQAVQGLAGDAAAILCVGTCACYGGIPKSGGNPTGVQTGKECVQEVYPSKGVINIPGCPTHPDWIAWAIVQLVLGNVVELDADDRPTALFGNKAADVDLLNIHENCPRNVNLGGTNAVATTFGQDGLCMEDQGCRGPSTYSNCPSIKWNNGVNWCVDSNGMCLGCVEPDFPGGDFYA